MGSGLTVWFTSDMNHPAFDAHPGRNAAQVQPDQSPRTTAVYRGDAPDPSKRGLLPTGASAPSLEELAAPVSARGNLDLASSVRSLGLDGVPPTHPINV